MKLNEQSRDFLIRLARRSIRRGPGCEHAAVPELDCCPPDALAYRACFVTLTTAAEGLRGCRGTLEARGPLAENVWQNAWASAFDDPRFAPVTVRQFDQLTLEISVLSPLETLPVSSEDELRRTLVPHSDGVVLAWRGCRSTFLPQVWEKLPDPGEFLAHLKLKAGLPQDFWAPDIVICRYRVESLHDTARLPVNEAAVAVI